MIVIDVNLTPRWADFFSEHEIAARHWSEIGALSAADETILRWAADNDCVVFTHDLDFGALLAAGGLRAPSVIQVRNAAPLPEVCGHQILDLLKRYKAQIQTGALISLDAKRARLRLLPLLQSE